MMVAFLLVLLCLWSNTEAYCAYFAGSYEAEEQNGWTTYSTTYSLFGVTLFDKCYSLTTGYSWKFVCATPTWSWLEYDNDACTGSVTTTYNIRPDANTQYSCSDVNTCQYVTVTQRNYNQINCDVASITNTKNVWYIDYTDITPQPQCLYNQLTQSYLKFYCDTNTNQWKMDNDYSSGCNSVDNVFDSSCVTNGYTKLEVSYSSTNICSPNALSTTKSATTVTTATTTTATTTKSATASTDVTSSTVTTTTLEASSNAITTTTAATASDAATNNPTNNPTSNPTGTFTADRTPISNQAVMCPIAKCVLVILMTMVVR